MTLLVDTSVWIDFFAGRPTSQVGILKQAVEDGIEVAVTELILAEILQGVPTDREFTRLRKVLSSFRLLRPSSDETFVEAARIYRLGRKKGTTIRSLVDCVVAALAIEHGATVLHRDRDYDRIARLVPLKIARPLRVVR